MTHETDMQQIEQLRGRATELRNAIWAHTDKSTYPDAALWLELETTAGRLAGQLHNIKRAAEDENAKQAKLPI